MEKKSDKFSFRERKEIKVILLKMKLLFVLIFIGSMAYSIRPYSQKTKIDLQFENSSLIEILSSIEKKSEFIFIYNDNVVNTYIKKSISVRDETIEMVLKNLFQGTDISSRIDDRQVFLYKQNNLKKPESVTIKTEVDQSTKKVITGIVKDNEGNTLPGVSVSVKGTIIGNITDANGKFSLFVTKDVNTLVFSFIGLETQEILVTDRSPINVTMKETAVSINEVLVVGYGVQKKESVVGSIVQTTNEQLKRSGGVIDMKQALTGNLPGVTTVTSSGEPGGTGRGESSTAIYIRGQNTWNGSQPLILVDGVERAMDNVDVNEVESISVLKDASATAVFGVKGANGVILITTKRGSFGKPQLSVSYNMTGKMLSKLPGAMDSYDAILTRDQAIENEGSINEDSWSDYIPMEIAARYKSPQTPLYSEIYPNVDWKKAMFNKVGISHHATLNVHGGTDFVKYFGLIAFLHEGDMLKDYDNSKGYDTNYNYDRFNFRSNLDFKITNTTNLTVNLSGIYSKKNVNGYGDLGGADSWMWSSIYSLAPDLFLPRYSDGRWGWTYQGTSTRVNPVAMAANIGVRTIHTTTLNSDFFLNQKLDFITKGLSAKVSLFYDNTILSESGISDVGAIQPTAGSNTPLKIIDSSLFTGPDQDPSEYTSNVPILGADQYDWHNIPWSILEENILPDYISRKMMYQFQLNYTRSFNKHNVGATGVFKREEYAEGSMFKTYREDWVFRTTYDYNTTYLFEMNGAYNGSEQFGPGYRFHFFPSVGLGYVLSNEKFFKIDWINRFKLRYSVGMVGDDKVGTGRWMYSDQYYYGGAAHLNQNIYYGYSPYNWYKQSVVGNPDLHWEKAKKTDYGLEFGLFKNLISVTYDYFTENRTDIMISGDLRSVPMYFGATPPSANLGRVKSSGHELELKYDKRVNGGFHYWANLALTHSTNKVINRDDPIMEADYTKAAGFSIGQAKTQIRAGFINNWDDVYASVPNESYDTQKLPGNYVILDFNGDGVIKADDSAPFGYSDVPKNTYNLSLGAEYKGFSFSVQLYGVNDVTAYVPLQDFAKETDKVFDHVADHWSKDNQNASSFLPRWKTKGQTLGDYFFYDASYLRLKNAEIAYTFQNMWVKRVGLSALKIYLNGNNLFFWSKLPNDRESSFSGGGGDVGTYPTVKRVNLGFDISF